MHAVKGAAEAGRVPAEAFDELRRRFNDVQVRAIEAFGEHQLLGAVRTIDSETYPPPSPDDFEKARPAAPVAAKTSPESDRLARARALVDEMRDQALAIGWTMESLYCCGGYDRQPLIAGYGLVYYIGTGHRIGEVTRQSIELIGPAPLETLSRFYNPDVEQPWVKRSSIEGAK